MWVFTESGFVSAVCDTPGSTTVKVRARDAQSLELLISMTGAPIIKTVHADYPYRVIVSKEDFWQFLIKSVQYMEYTNFKNQVYATRGATYAHALSDVWSTMHDVEDEMARKEESS